MSTGRMSTGGWGGGGGEWPLRNRPLGNTHCRSPHIAGKLLEWPHLTSKMVVQIGVTSSLGFKKLQVPHDV